MPAFKSFKVISRKPTILMRRKSFTRENEIPTLFLDRDKSSESSRFLSDRCFDLEKEKFSVTKKIGERSWRSADWKAEPRSEIDSWISRKIKSRPRWKSICSFSDGAKDRSGFILEKSSTPFVLQRRKSIRFRLSLFRVQNDETRRSFAARFGRSNPSEERRWLVDGNSQRKWILFLVLQKFFKWFVRSKKKSKFIHLLIELTLTD